MNPGTTGPESPPSHAAPPLTECARGGRGFRNFDNYRLRRLLHYGVD